MVDEFLITEIKKRIENEKWTLTQLKNHFEKLYSQEDIQDAYSAYLHNKEIELQKIDELEKLKKKHPLIKIDQSPLRKFVTFLFDNPLPTFLLITFIFFFFFSRLVTARTFASQGQYIGFVIFWIIVYYFIFLFISKLLSAITNFIQGFENVENEFLRGIQLQLLNALLFFLFINVAEYHDTISIIIFFFCAIIFMIVLISLMYKIQFSQSITLFIFFQILFWVIWYFAAVFNKIIFPILQNT